MVMEVGNGAALPLAMHRPAYAKFHTFSVAHFIATKGSLLSLRNNEPPIINCLRNALMHTRDI